jgi:CheY-like chemotaxis protein
VSPRGAAARACRTCVLIRASFCFVATSILINGLSNSIKFTKQGSIRVVLSMSDDLKKVTIRIIDTGIGIKAKFAPKIFEPFTKSDSFSPGAGLGLYITKGLVDRMSGTLALSPNPHGGTTFEVVLPIRLLDTNKQTEAREKVVKPIKGWLTQQDDAVPSTEMPDSSGDESRQQPQQSQHQQQQNPESDLSFESDKVRVLVVDDNDISRKLLLMALRKSPTKVSTAQATNGQEAIDKFRDFRPDLVLTDVSMPIMDGLTAAGQMRRAEDEFDTVDARSRIFAITGLGSSDPRLQKEGEASLDGWLVKGEHGLDVIYKIVRETGEKRTQHRAAHRAEGEKQDRKVVAGENDETAEHGEQNKPESDREG